MLWFDGGAALARRAASLRSALARRRSDQNQGDIVSVVTFDSSPHVVATHQPIDQAPGLVYSGGGTCFAPAIATCQQLMVSAPSNYTPVLIFMSDGEDGYGGADGAMRQLYLHLHTRNVQVHTIAFGRGIQLLQNMATAAGGHYHTAASGVQLHQVFVQIAAECSAVDGLVKKFSEKLTEMITVKIMVGLLAEQHNLIHAELRQRKPVLPSLLTCLCLPFVRRLVNNSGHMHALVGAWFLLNH